MTVPAELRALPQWLVWRIEARDDKPTKVPYRPTEPRRRADSTDPATWGTYDQALAASRLEDVAGIGSCSPRSTLTAGSTSTTA